MKRDRAAIYAAHLRTTPEFLLYGRQEVSPANGLSSVPLVGYIGAGSQAHFFAAEKGAGHVEPPPGATDTTRAIEIRTEDGFGAAFDHWVAFYDETEGGITSGHLGQLCLVGLPGGRVLVKKLSRSRSPGLFHLTSGVAEPILDQEIEWAFRITCMKPR